MPHAESLTKKILDELDRARERHEPGRGYRLELDLTPDEKELFDTICANLGFRSDDPKQAGTAFAEMFRRYVTGVLGEGKDSPKDSR